MPRSAGSMATPSGSIRIRLLGPVSVEVGGAPLVVDTRKAVALLAYLAVTRRPASRESVAALLWPEADGPDARGALRRTLSVLNRGLGRPGLIIDRSAVAIDPSVIDVDVWRFATALGVARGHVHPGGALCPACGDALRAARDLDRGEFMAGFSLRDSEEFDEWQSAESASHRRELAGVLERLARGDAAAGSWDEAVATARRWLELDPLHEPAHRLLMEILARSGEPAAALAQYRDCVRILDRELGVAPLPETTDLADEIRAGRLTQAPVVPPLVPWKAPTLDTPAPVRAPFVGRADELRVLVASLEGIDAGGRLLAIEGEPGVGKTRLAVAVGDAVRARGGTVLDARAYAGEAAIPLSSVAELIRAGLARPDAAPRLDLVDPGILEEATRLLPLPGVRVTAMPPEVDPFGRVRLFESLTSVLSALLGEPGSGLLVVDDLHLADASTIEFLGYLTRRLAEHPFGLLVTWRAEDLEPGIRERILDVAIEADRATSVVLGRFDRSGVAALVAAVLGSAAIDDARVDRLFEESEGLPLYIVEALAEPDAPATATPAGVQALLRSRIGSLSEIGRQVLGAAAVIGRSFDLAIVRAASGRSEEEAVDGLDELIRRGLVRELQTAPAADLELDFTHAHLRAIAYDSLSLARRRLLHARVASALIAGTGAPRDGGVRWSQIAYHETLAGRAEAAAEAHRRAGDVARSVFANDEAREHLETALALGHPAVAELHGALGEVLTLLGDYEGALFHLASAVAFTGPEDRSTLAALEVRQGQVHARRGDWDRADVHLVTALDLTDDAATRSRILVDRSAIAGRSAAPEVAERLAREALGLAEAVDDPVGIARSLDLLGILARRRGDRSSARADLERALEVVDAAAVADPGVRIAALNTLALVVADEGDRDRAIALTLDALARCERQGDRHRQAALENNLADLFQATGRPAEAMAHLKIAVALFAEIGGRPGELEPEIWKLVEW